MSRTTLLALGLLLILVGISLFQLEGADRGLGWALRSTLAVSEPPTAPAPAPSPAGAPDAGTALSGSRAMETADDGGPRTGGDDEPSAVDESKGRARSAAAPPEGAVLRFERRDPSGDDYGGGRVVYPSHRSFAPYRGLFDLTHFSVWEGDDAFIFDVSLAALKNPWNAPEGFSHPLVDIYVDAGAGGATRPVRSGPEVRFHPKFAWDVRIKVAPFGESRLFRAEAPGQPRPSGVSDALRVYRLDDDATIRIEVPRRLMPDWINPWRYYVWVAGFDVFGPDGYRDVTREGGAWAFGGTEQDPVPRVIDLLARGFGPRSQVRLLRRAEPGATPVLVPVGPGAPGQWFSRVFPFAMLAVLVVVAALFVGVLRTQRGRGTRHGAGRRGGGGPFARR